jgi:hypothetical protein
MEKSGNLTKAERDHLKRESVPILRYRPRRDPADPGKKPSDLRPGRD